MRVHHIDVAPNLMNRVEVAFTEIDPRSQTRKHVPVREGIPQEPDRLCVFDRGGFGASRTAGGVMKVWPPADVARSLAVLDP